ncbi:hypothetical protein RDV89_06685 [Nocardioides zeae]|uniref:ATP-binding protein n=1 Tax=Nocardioides imazamoxiresistens TaxID=3231893 RepID=A0ABU3PU54_9ACTN|nr:hypothetical protein [Nocardioides zeae]MDT9592745.1 hypothetical protein [Nocardioides zeae]
MPDPTGPTGPTDQTGPPLARVVVLAGPSGSGKSRLAERLGLPVLRLDDFYRDGDDPALPHIAEGPNAGVVDWDDPASWLAEEALAALVTLCTEGTVEVPVYEIAANGRTGTQRLDLGGSPLFVTEGIFAAEVVAECERRGLLAAAYCLTQPPTVTFWRRLTRDLREHRKPPLLLVRRGVALAREQRRIVAHAVSRGCVPASTHEAFSALRDLAARAEARPARTGTSLRAALEGFVQPDATTCGSCCLVAAHLHHAPSYAARVLVPAASTAARLRSEALAVHRATSRFRLAGETQLPWPRALGTAPWAVARHLRLVSGRPGTGYAYVARREDFWERLQAATNAGHPVPLYVGTRLLPRHVVLVLEANDDHLLAYQPATGRIERVTRGAVNRSEAAALGWPHVWGGVLPTTATVRPERAERAPWARRARVPRRAAGVSAAPRTRA